MYNLHYYAVAIIPYQSIASLWRKVLDVVWVVYEYRDAGVIVAVEDDWGRRDAVENGEEGPVGVYQPSVPDKRIQAQTSYSRAQPPCGVITQTHRPLWLVLG